MTPIAKFHGVPVQLVKRMDTKTMVWAVSLVRRGLMHYPNEELTDEDVTLMERQDARQKYYAKHPEAKPHAQTPKPV